MDDPQFVRPIPRNSWGGASQALTALRAGRWFDFYHRSAEFSVLMDAWCQAIQRDMTFRQQLDPDTGAFTQLDAPGYSPCALVMIDFTWRLAGICEQSDTLHWNVCPGHPAAASARFRMRTDEGRSVEMQYGTTGADLILSGKTFGRIESGIVKLVTDKVGVPKGLVGISETPQTVVIRLNDRKALNVTAAANEEVML
jgi:hypothetical protein